MRVIIADDDATSRLTLSILLKRLGHEVISVRDGAEVLDEHRRRPAPLIISDWLMPGTSGLDVCREIRGSDSKTYTYFIMVTSLSDRESCIEGFRVGVDDFVVKPIVPEELAARIGAAERMVRHQLADKERHLRDSIELSQQGATLNRGDEPADGGLSDKVAQLVDVYRAQDVAVKARAFLRRQIAIEEERGGDAPRIALLRTELQELARQK